MEVGGIAFISLCAMVVAGSLVGRCGFRPVHRCSHPWTFSSCNSLLYAICLSCKPCNNRFLSPFGDVAISILIRHVSFLAGCLRNTPWLRAWSPRVEVVKPGTMLYLDEYMLNEQVILNISGIPKSRSMY